MAGDARKRRIRPLEAWRAIRALLRNPDDTGQVFRIIDALSGNSGERTFRRFRSDPTGARILQERRSLLKTLGDLEALRALPEGTLGRTYAEFVTREQISADGLVAASQEGSERWDYGADRRLVGDRLRDMHDLWHVVTGYGRDLVGEAALLAFSFAQVPNPGVGFIVAVAWLRAGAGGGMRGLIVEGWRRGRSAAWLPAKDWEALLRRPLEDVRAELRVGAPPRYQAVRSSGAPQVAY
ncbi:MAG TPA: Coq4 family protein [Myxococcota bacterium]|jgi:ubiquinone biosynthesis protein COQ4|nr:Coq4 family protein [Myxococcota bacterium]